MSHKFSKKYLEEETKYTQSWLDLFYSLPDGDEKEKVRLKVLEKREEFKTDFWPYVNTTDEDATTNKP